MNIIANFSESKQTFNSLNLCLTYNLENNYNSIRERLVSRNNNDSKRRRLDVVDMIPILFGDLCASKHVQDTKRDLRILLDSGASGSVIHSRFLKKFKNTREKKSGRLCLENLKRTVRQTWN